MYKIYLEVDGGWQDTSLSEEILEEAIKMVLDLEKQNPENIYRIEEISGLVSKVIEFKN